MIKFSVIIPIYNCEKCLGKCIDSIINQTYNNIEIILVNDGSTDKSGIICDEYKKKDDRIKVIHQNNQGVSSARNRGIEEANGEYVLFVDSDDWIKKDTIQIIYNKMNNCCQLVMFQIINNKSQYFFVNNARDFNRKLSEMIINETINSPVNKLYKRDILNKYKIRFKNDINIAEDLLFNIQYFSNINSFEILPDECYYYSRDNNNSLTKRYNYKKYEELMFVDNEMEIILYKYNSSSINKALKYIRIKNIFSCIKDLNNIECSFSIKEKKIYIRKMQKENKVNVLFGCGFRPFLYSLVYKLIRNPKLWLIITQKR